MAKVSQQSLDNAQAFWQVQVQPHCPACDSAIPSGHWRQTVHLHDFLRNSATAQAHCPFCDRVYQVELILQGAVWQSIGPLRVIMDPRSRQSIKKALEKQRGSEVLDKATDLRRTA